MIDAPVRMARGIVRGSHDDGLRDAAAIGGATLGTFGAAFSWHVDRLPRLAVASALTGMLAGSIGGAIIASGTPLGDPDSKLQGAAGGGLAGAGGGALLFAGIGGIVLPAITTVRRFPAMREFALYGTLLGGGIGAAVGAVRSPLAVRDVR